MMPGLSAGFMAGTRGDLFYLYIPPSGETGDRGDIIYVPPFAEEMNRARNLVFRQAKTFSQIGYGVLVLDLYGTGDSEGDFADARWETWREDVISAIRWLSEQGRNRVSLWGIRLGALLAADVAFDRGQDIDTLLLWEPVTSGKHYLDQFLRIGLAADATRGRSAITESGDRLKLSRTMPIEIAGYIVARAMTHAIDRSDMSFFKSAGSAKIRWFERGKKDEPPIHHTAVIIDQWRAAGTDVQFFRSTFPAFWALEHSGVPADLHDLSLEMMRGIHAGS